MSIFLQGRGLKNYRGIGPAVQMIGPFKECNFFIGTNNSGKSCVLNFIASHLGGLGKLGGTETNSLKLSPLEVHLGATATNVQVSIAQSKSFLLDKCVAIVTQRKQIPTDLIVASLNRLLDKLADSGLIWATANAVNLQSPHFANLKNKNIDEILSVQQWRDLWIALTNQTGGDLKRHWIPETMTTLLSQHNCAYPVAKMIPAIRQIGMKGGKFDDFSGVGLIDQLAELQNPGPTDRELKKKFDLINKFLQDVISDSSAMIEIPHNREEVLVHKRSRVLPLSSLGTGVHEVVMIAAFCMLTDNSIICIEEPEIHLHPVLQRKLISYISKKDDNQYFIATHSPSIIDHAGASVFHVTQDAECTKVERATEAHQKFQVCQDLGYRASDLLQTNSIIWVEGPSDRVYLNHWITSVEPEFIESIHYSIMFYGGRLLGHLSADDAEISEFIALKKLNRNIAVVIDSDRKTSRSTINNTKKRVVGELSLRSEIGWVTAGREIENYIKPEVLNPVLASLYKNFDSVESEDKFSHRLNFRTVGKTGKIFTEVDKMKVARAVCKYPADLGVYDLNIQIQRIVEMIRKANEK